MIQQSKDRVKLQQEHHQQQQQQQQEQQRGVQIPPSLQPEIKPQTSSVFKLPSNVEIQAAVPLSPATSTHLLRIASHLDSVYVALPVFILVELSALLLAQSIFLKNVSFHKLLTQIANCKVRQHGVRMGAYAADDG
jgi:hypothetical protein